MGLARRSAHVLGLTTLAIGQPLLDLLGREPTFLVAHSITGWRVAYFGLAVLLIPAAVLMALEMSTRVISHRAPAAAHVGVVAVVSGAAVMLPVGRIIELPFLLFPVALLAAGAAVAWLYSSSDAVRRTTDVLAIGPLVVMALFLFGSPARDVLSTGSGVAGGVAARTPVVVLVLDGLSLAHLLESDGTIAELRFPNFAELAATSTWYRNATTVHPHTASAVPALLTGNRPLAPGVPPTVVKYPRNLFTMLGPAYEISAKEDVTLLCPPKTCGRSPDWSVVGDSGLVYLHQLLPDSWAAPLPPVDNRWGNFGVDTASGTAVECPVDPMGATAAFNAFLGGIQRTGEPSLHYLHLPIPHDPWLYLPDGSAYDGQSVPGLAGERNERWGDSQFLADRGLQQIVLQSMYTDTLLGQLMDHLRAEEMFDETLLAVVSDHGIGFASGQPRREVTDENFDEVARIPMFVKAPGQLHGAVVDQNTESIDFVPILSSVLEGTHRWEFDGTPTPETQPRPVKRVYSDSEDVVTVSGDAGAPRGARMDALFGAGYDVRGLFAFDETRTLVGRRLDELVVGEPAGWTASETSPGKFKTVDMRCPPARLTGILHPPGEPEHVQLAVTVNGVVGGTAWTYAISEGSLPFGLMFDWRLLSQGDNDVRLFVIEGDALLSVAVRE